MDWKSKNSRISVTSSAPSSDKSGAKTPVFYRNNHPTKFQRNRQNCAVNRVRKKSPIKHLFRICFSNIGLWECFCAPPPHHLVHGSTNWTIITASFVMVPQYPAQYFNERISWKCCKNPFWEGSWPLIPLLNAPIESKIWKTIFHSKLPNYWISEKSVVRFSFSHL